METELLLLCLKIFAVRIIDVSLGTLRTMVVVKGKKMIAVVIGFIEVLIWFLVVREALNTEVQSIWIAISYAGGFATGTYVGIFISDKYIKELLTIQIITHNYKDLAMALRENGFGVTTSKVNGINEKEKKYMLFVTLKSDKYPIFNKIIKEHDKNAFIVINESKYAKNGYFLDQIKK